ncbi:MAG: HAMP domain-containing sensor histidine kinase, partial [Verrucomicrobiota bacterium]
EPFVSLALPAPLSSWRLDYHSARSLALAGPSSSGLLGFGLLLALLLLGFLALAYYLYREYSRDLREASQRVTFVNQVSHELKTPLTNIRMYAELLESRLGNEDEHLRKSVGIIVEESQRLSRLITNVLTFSQKRQEKLQLHPRTGVLDETIDNALEQFRPHLEKLGFHIQFHANAETPCRYDPDAVEQILINLISNVEKYATTGKHLEIHSSLEGNLATILVTDHGPGIPSDKVEWIFQPFERLQEGLSDVAGTGIGLNLARHLARLHGGEVIARSDVEQGATFQVTLQAS